MKLMILITKDDVVTNPMGKNFEIRKGEIILNFTKEAMDEIVSDYQKLKEEMKISE